VGERFRDPGIPDGETGRYRGSIDGDRVGGGTLRIEHLGEGGERIYRQHIEMTVREHMRYALEVDFLRAAGGLRARRYRLTTAHDDTPVSVEEGWFEGISALHWGGDLVPYPADITPLLGCAVALRGMDFARGERRSVPLWLANTVWWEIEVRVERRERISVPAGAFDAWRVRARPSFGQVAGALDRVIGMLLPPFVLHLETAEPHRFLRFEFPTGPFPWNPRGLIEAEELG
jgi:hypothetical protein